MLMPEEMLAQPAVRSPATLWMAPPEPAQPQFESAVWVPVLKQASPIPSSLAGRLRRQAGCPPTAIGSGNRRATHTTNK